MPDVVKAVINTNVFVSALLSPTGASAKILDRFYNSEFQLAVSAEILDEYRSVILEFENKIYPDDANEFIELVEAQSIQYETIVALTVCKDPSDNKFIECAISSGAYFLVTKNLRHYPIKEFRGVKTNYELRVTNYELNWNGILTPTNFRIVARNEANPNYEFVAFIPS